MPGPAKLNDNLNIPFAELNLSQLFYVAHPLTGIGGKNTLQALRDLIASTLPSGGGLAPITLYPTVVEMLANETLQPNHFALVINEPVGEGGEDDPTEWLLYVYMGGARDNLDNYFLLTSEEEESMGQRLGRLVIKATHGFTPGDIITLNSSGVPVKVDNPATNKFIGIVSEVIDTDTFVLVLGGYIAGLSGLTAGQIHYAQSDGTLGTAATDMPVLFADSTGSGYILASGASASSGIRSGDAVEGEEGVYTLTLDPAITEYKDGAAFLIRFDISSINGVGEDTTLNINSLGAKSIRRYPGVRLLPGDINNVQHYFVTYNASSGHFQVHHLPFLPNSVTNKASYVDVLGRFRIAQGSTYDASSQAWTHTGTDDSNTELVKWQNLSEELIFRLLNDKTAEFGHDGESLIEVPDEITSGNAYLSINDDQAEAWQIIDKLGNILMTFKTTDGDIGVILHSLEKQFTPGFKTVVRQASTTVDTTAGAQNVIAAIPTTSGLPMKVKINHAFAATEAGRMISIDSLQAVALNSSGTLSGATEGGNDIYSGGPASGGFNINLNDTTDEIEIRFENEAGTGFAYTIWLEYEYTVPL